MLLKQVLDKAHEDGFKFVAYYDDRNDPDYAGTDVDQVKEALEACDLMNLRVEDGAGKFQGWFLIVNEFEGDPEEQIADYAITDWVRQFEQGDL